MHKYGFGCGNGRETAFAVNMDGFEVITAYILADILHYGSNSLTYLTPPQQALFDVLLSLVVY